MNGYKIGTVDWFRKECKLLDVSGSAAIQVIIDGKRHKIEGMMFVREDNVVELTGYDFLSEEEKDELKENGNHGSK